MEKCLSHAVKRGIRAYIIHLFINSESADRNIKWLMGSYQIGCSFLLVDNEFMDRPKVFVQKGF